MLNRRCQVCLVLLLCGLQAKSLAASYEVTDILISSIAQEDDDEEAPIVFWASNKTHKCGGKPSNRFIVFSEHSQVSQQRTLLLQLAFTQQFTVSVSTKGCYEKALRVDAIRIHR